jgi:hypothetical protein
MANELEPMKQQRRAELPATVLPLTKEARQIAQMDRQSVMRARRDFNQARERTHRVELDKMVEKAEADMRAELADYAMYKAREVDDVARHLEGSREALSMTIREYQAAYNAGEVAQIVKRGYQL